MQEKIDLKKIRNPDFLKLRSVSDLELLSKDIRKQLIKILSTTGGHLASNLGVVELTLSLHKIFNSPLDKIIFDTGHQCYIHKILTGRLSFFDKLRKFGGLSGFISPEESEHDHFYSGHAGNALSLGLGMAYSRDLSGDDYYILVVLGDATLSCGLTLEAFNNISKKIKNFFIIINDNSMSISENVGSISKLMNKVGRNKKSWVKKNRSLVSDFLLEDFGFRYHGPIDGNNLESLLEKLYILKSSNHDHPVLLHITTKKGKGVKFSELDPVKYHGSKPFDMLTGKFKSSSNSNTTKTFPQIFGKVLVEIGKDDESLCVVTPAMSVGSSLVEFKEKFQNRFYDVGIAEGHAISFSAGLGKTKRKKVVCCIYSTFLQRAFDNVFHDVCVQNIPILIAIDRCGISGGDGVTANGFYDISFLYSMPNLVIAQPRNGIVLKEILNSDFTFKVPLAIRYPNLKTSVFSEEALSKRSIGKSEILKKGNHLVFIALGHMVYTALEVAKLLESKGISAYVIDPIFISPIDKETFSRDFLNKKIIVTIEDGLLISGFSTIFNDYLIKNNIDFKKLISFGISGKIVKHGDYDSIVKHFGFDANSIAKRIAEDEEVLSFYQQKALI